MNGRRELKNGCARRPGEEPAGGSASAALTVEPKVVKAHATILPSRRASSRFAPRVPLAT
ncbi:Hypothetical protein A7982_11386 [Minicystis rosea]|nr:Hypothetical protein A7982_11386 [Minicystis rosea]